MVAARLVPHPCLPQAGALPPCPSTPRHIAVRLPNGPPCSDLTARRRRRAGQRPACSRKRWAAAREAEQQAAQEASSEAAKASGASDFARRQAAMEAARAAVRAEASEAAAADEPQEAEAAPAPAPAGKAPVVDLWTDEPIGERDESDVESSSSSSPDPEPR